MDHTSSTSTASALQPPPETSQDEPVTGHSESPAGSKQRASRKQNKSKNSVPCRFFAKHGCRAGEACPFLHDKELVVSSSNPRSRADLATSSLPPINHGNNIKSADLDDEVEVGSPALSLPIRASSRTPIPRPLAQQQRVDPRGFEISQLKRRFSPTVREDENATVLVFKLVPSDPDFPFELAGLETTLFVPKAYPDGAPSIHIDNVAMERGYQINVEKGFDALVVKYPTKTLLALMNELDKTLETLLVSQKAATVKLIANADKLKKPVQFQRAPEPKAAPTSDSLSSPTEKNFTTQQLQEAKSKRERDVRQIEARLGRQPLYSRSPDGTIYNIPLQVPKTGRLPLSLQKIGDLRLNVPPVYPLEACTIRLREVSKEADQVERIFAKHACENPGLTLIARINYLVQNMHIMAQEISVPGVDAVKPTTDTPSYAKEVTIQADEPQLRLLDQDRPHIQVVPRPPEWDLNATDSEDDDSEASESMSDSEWEEGGAELPPQDEHVTGGPERGILLSFPMLELYGIELLHISSLSVTIKCDRCKDTLNVKGLKPATSSNEVSRIIESCKKCASNLSVAYRSEPMHMNSIRAGFLDLEGCTIVDMLPSQFQPTCSECSTTFPKPGVVSIRGETSMEMCRECHKKMTFRLPEIRWLRVSSAERPNRPLPRKTKKEHLGIVAGTELPRKGRCRHYSKSFRWFRFSCCQRVYACDRCHGDVEDHPNEHANRMICGLCSREQNYRPEDCAFCHSSLVGKKTGGFWEGGKGTRDKSKMSKKDPRKYKRRGGGAMSAKAK